MLKLFENYYTDKFCYIILRLKATSGIQPNISINNISNT